MGKKYTRCIHIFPKFKNSESLQFIRENYDYLHDCIEPHITLVFPFTSDLTIKEIQSELEEILKEVKPFKISTCELEGVDSYGYNLFLNIDEGKKEIKELHYKLYEGILEPYQPEWTNNGVFVPHITVGRFDNRIDMMRAVNETSDFENRYITIVEKLYIEIIGENDESIIEGIVKLGNR